MSAKFGTQMRSMPDETTNPRAMAMAFTAWLSAPAPTTCTSTAPACRRTLAMAPATAFGLDLLETLSTSMLPPARTLRQTSCWTTRHRVIRRRRQLSLLGIPPEGDRAGRRRGERGGRPRETSGQTQVEPGGRSWWPPPPLFLHRDGLVVFRPCSQRNVVGPRSHSDLLSDALVELDHQLGVLQQELLGVLPALAELLALVGVPGSGLLHDAQVDGDVDDRSLPADAPAVHDVELSGFEGRRALVLHHLDPRAVADDLAAVLDGLDPADVEADRGVELERSPTGSHLRRAVHHPDLLPELVDEDGDGVGPAEGPGELAQRLGHEAGLEADVGVAHLPLDLGPGGEGGDRVDDQHVEGPRPDEHVGDLEGLLPRVGLGDQELVDVDADGLGVHRVHGVLGVDVRADASVALPLGHHVHGQGRLPRRLGPVELDDPAPGQPSHAQGQVEGHGAGGDGLDGHVHPIAHAHDPTLAELLLPVTRASSPRPRTGTWRMPRPKHAVAGPISAETAPAPATSMRPKASVASPTSAGAIWPRNRSVTCHCSRVVHRTPASSGRARRA